ncbi:Clarin-3-like protein [Dinothrombium tinctorium]|uniref:Clarin-3-like protein n=1 Tax=Dinothrombium tinctorium TaxID=1965070 RepID=A0A3S3RS28_9ACAR|nr:Clarin-3-like protein [Dinothrombium tinctorium]RWS05124.1 Clarin-3-like protein [Dinothrombium tinctorium]
MPFGLWLFTVLSIAIAIMFGIVSSIFAIINTVMTPIEVITGLHGLFLWNGMGALFCTSACVSWLIQYRNKLRRNVLTQDEISYGWNSTNRSWLGYSFFFVVAALSLYLFNIFLVYLAVRRPWQKRQSRPSQDKNPEGVIMLY